MKFDEKLKSVICNTDIPDDLLPENIQKMLSDKKSKSIFDNPKLGMYVRLSASAAVILLIFTFFSFSVNVNTPQSNGKYYQVYEAFNEVAKYNDELVTHDDNNQAGHGLNHGDSDIKHTFGAIDRGSYPTKNYNAKAEFDHYTNTTEQVEGVHESDIIKTDGKYIYRLSYQNNTVYIIRTEGKELYLEKKISYKTKGNIAEMYLNKGKLVILSQIQNLAYVKHLSEREHQYGNYIEGKYTTVMESYDISNPKSPALSSNFKQDGAYATSRLIGDNLYLLTNKTISYLPENQNKYWQYIPYYQQNDETKMLIDPDNIHIDKNSSEMAYSILSGHDLIREDSLQSIHAFAGHSGQYYVSNDHFYITSDVDGIKTKITSLLLDNGNIILKAKGSVKGSVRNQFSMDQYDGNFRIATTTDTDKLSNNLFILDKDMKIMGSITGIAKKEKIKSVRFDNEKAYLVTFKIEDPLFTIDCRNPYKPKILGKLRIPGYSTYMQNVDKKTILGFGNTANHKTGIANGLKLSLFDITSQKSPKEIAKYEIKEKGDEYLMSAEEYSHKDLMIDTVNQLIGFEVYDYDKEKSTYYLFSYGDNKIRKLLKVKLVTTYYSEEISVRGTIIDNYLYISSDDEMIAVNLLNEIKENTLTFK